MLCQADELAVNQRRQPVAERLDGLEQPVDDRHPSSQPSPDLARVMSGLLSVGSSTGRGMKVIGDGEPTRECTEALGR